MIITAPFSIGGEAGKSLDLGAVPTSVLGVTDATLKQRSLDVDVLTFSLQDNGQRPAIPDDGQWLTVYDASGQRIFAGLAKRSFEYPSRIYKYEATNVYKGLMETPLVASDGRAFLLYLADDLGNRLRDILIRAGNAGLPIQAPADMPDLYHVPAMTFRSATYGSALEDMCKWAPDLVTRMDYSTEPPTLRFSTRTGTDATQLSIDASDQRGTRFEITPMPEARALGVSFTYARRQGDDLILMLQQSAGDMEADSRRRLNIYLSGMEKSDALASEAVNSAQIAIAKINEVIAAAALSVDDAAATAQIIFNWSSLLPLDSNLQAAVTAQAGFTMYASGGESITLYTGVSWPPGSPWTGTNTMPSNAVRLRTAGGALATGWYPIKTGAFTAAQLSTAGAIKETRYIRGSMLAVRTILENNAGMASIQGAGAIQHTGWITGWVHDSAAADEAYRKYVKYELNIAVDAINMSPSAVAAALAASSAGTPASGFTQRAEFIEAPEDLAKNYFERQDWTPHKGELVFSPTAANLPGPGDFVSILGSNLPAEWAEMRVPISETSIDLATRAAVCTIGPSPRQDFQSLIDRLRIPQEDNYQAG